MRGEAFFVGKPVESLQAMLRQIAAVEASVDSVIPNGRFGQDTARAVASFQRFAHLPQTGKVDLATWNAIVAAFERAAVDIAPPATIPIWQIAQVIAPGEENGHLYLIQGMLLSLSRLFGGFTPPQVNGRLDEPTAAALRWIQRTGGLPETGALDNATWRKLSALYRSAWGDGTMGRG